ncbi:hypothetical protein [Coleofasciculus sp. E2-BRE-01]|uniref:hypothetical protein n=1 Tax=Coleofasciculus sp. E2-BRE-01 TaxID=3069524 RepID=UPI0032F97180
MAVYFPRGQKSFSDISTKLQGDISGATRYDPSGIAFVTNQELSLRERQQLRQTVASLKLELFHLERLTVILDSPSMAGVRKQFLGIDSGESVPVLDLQFFEPGSRKPLGRKIKLQSVAYDLPKQPIPNLEQPRTSYSGGLSLPVPRMEEVNPSYMRDKEKFVRASSLLRTVFLGIRNTSTILAENVKLEVEGSLLGGIQVEKELPQSPVRRRIEKVPYKRSLLWNSHITPDIEVHGDQWRMTVRFGNIQPGYQSIMEVPFLLGSRECKELTMYAKIFANNLPSPVDLCLQTEFEVISKPPLGLDFLAR